MRSITRRLMMKAMLAGVAVGVLPTTLVAAPPAPAVSISLINRDSKAFPVKKGFVHTGAGNIDVQQPTPNTLVITMTGVAVAGALPVTKSLAQMGFELSQDIEISFDDPKVKAAKLTIEGRVIGLLRSHKGGGLASVAEGCASVGSGPASIVGVCTPAHTVNNGVNLSINDKVGPISAPVVAGLYNVHQKWCVTASHPASVVPCKAASSEFAPDPALDPLWISYWEPFHGAAKKDFGFQITITVTEETVAAPTPPKKTSVTKVTTR